MAHHPIVVAMTIAVNAVPKPAHAAAVPIATPKRVHRVARVAMVVENVVVVKQVAPVAVDQKGDQNHAAPDEKVAPKVVDQAEVVPKPLLNREALVAKVHQKHDEKVLQKIDEMPVPNTDAAHKLDGMVPVADALNSEAVRTVPAVTRDVLKHVAVEWAAARWPNIDSVRPDIVDPSSARHEVASVMDHRDSDDMPQSLHTEWGHQAVVTVHSSVHTEVALDMDHPTLDGTPVDSADSRVMGEVDRGMQDALEPNPVTMDLNSEHIAVASDAGHLILNIMSADTVDITATSVDMAQLTAAGSVRKVVIMVPNSAHTVGALAADNRNSDIMPVDTVVSTAISVDQARTKGISSDLIEVVHTSVLETAIVVHNSALAI
jgi:hypothetical protein